MYMEGNIVTKDNHKSAVYLSYSSVLFSNYECF